MADDLARRIRDYARGRGRAATATSSAWLAREFGVDPRTIAAALRPFGVRPGEVEPGVRGYVIAQLAGIVFEVGQVAEPDPADGSAVDRLSEALGHPAGPVLRAAGLL
jgi:hypothetical protein